MRTAISLLIVLVAVQAAQANQVPAWGSGAAWASEAALSHPEKSSSASKFLNEESLRLIDRTVQIKAQGREKITEAMKNKSSSLLDSLKSRTKENKNSTNMINSSSSLASNNTQKKNYTRYGEKSQQSDFGVKAIGHFLQVDEPAIGVKRIIGTTQRKKAPLLNNSDKMNLTYFDMPKNVTVPAGRSKVITKKKETPIDFGLPNQKEHPEAPPN